MSALHDWLTRFAVGRAAPDEGEGEGQEQGDEKVSHEGLVEEGQRKVILGCTPAHHVRDGLGDESACKDRGVDVVVTGLRAIEDVAAMAMGTAP